MTITPEEQRRYPLVGKDAEILKIIHEIEGFRDLSPNERFLLLFLRTQLEEEWRDPCLQLLTVWLEKRELPPEERWRQLRESKQRWWNPADL